MGDYAKTKAKRAWRREHGICYKCGRAPAKNGGMCETCSEKCRLYQRQLRAEYREIINAKVAARRNERKAAGLCARCGKRPTRPGYVMCQQCAEHIAKYSNQRYYKNRVLKPVDQCRWCERPCVPGYRFCEIHLAQARANMAKAYTKRKQTRSGGRNG